jgi:hypothetical protein
MLRGALASFVGTAFAWFRYNRFLAKRQAKSIEPKWLFDAEKCVSSEDV